MRLVATIATGFSTLIYSLLVFLLFYFEKKRSHRLFLVYLIGLLCWQVNAFAITITKEIDTARLCYYIAFIGNAFSFSFMLPIVSLLTNRRRTLLPIIIALVSAFFPIILYISLTPPPLPMIIGKAGIYVPQLNPLLITAFVPSFSLAFLSIILLAVSIGRTISPVQKSRQRHFFQGFTLNILALFINATPLQDFPLDILLHIAGAFILLYVMLSFRFLQLSNRVDHVVRLVSYMFTGFVLFIIILAVFQLLIVGTIIPQMLIPSVLALLTIVHLHVVVKKKQLSDFYVLPVDRPSNSRLSFIHTFTERAVIYYSYAEAVSFLLEAALKIFGSQKAYLISLNGDRPTQITVNILRSEEPGLHSFSIDVSGQDFSTLYAVQEYLWTEDESKAYYTNLLKRLDGEVFNQLSYIIAPLATGKTTKTLLLLSTQHRKAILTLDDYILLETFSHISSSFLQRIYTTDKLEKSLSEKVILLREVHHRVKNNLQIISSLLNLQMQNSDYPEVQSALKDSRNRVYSMAAVHDHLYRSDTLSEIKLKIYLQNLIDHLRIEYSGDSRNVRTVLDCPDITLPLEYTINLGLIVTELVSNCYKYAFTNTDDGSVRVILSNSPDGSIILSISDDGIGNIRPVLEHPGGFGLKLVQILVESNLSGTWKVESNGGVHHTIRFNL